MTFFEFADKHFGWFVVLAILAIIVAGDVFTSWADKRSGRL